jgi:hypothetical protein
MSGVGEVIRAVAEGATGGLRALQDAGLEVGVETFDVDVAYAGDAEPAADPGEVSASLRLRFVMCRAAAAERDPTQPA